jgi:hypothetical protein
MTEAEKIELLNHMRTVGRNELFCKKLSDKINENPKEINNVEITNMASLQQIYAFISDYQIKL